MTTIWRDHINEWAAEIVGVASEEDLRSMAAGNWDDFSQLSGWDEIPEDCRVEAHDLLCATVRAIAEESVNWKPTHRITWTPSAGESQEWEVMLVDGVGYTHEEWADFDKADWEYDDLNGWTFQGQAAPFGSGNVEVERL